LGCAGILNDSQSEGKEFMHKGSIPPVTIVMGWGFAVDERVWLHLGRQQDGFDEAGQERENLRWFSTHRERQRRDGWCTRRYNHGHIIAYDLA
jgi:hypothetical protein